MKVNASVSFLQHDKGEECREIWNGSKRLSICLSIDRERHCIAYQIDACFHARSSPEMLTVPCVHGKSFPSRYASVL